MFRRPRHVVRASSAAASVGLPKGIFAALRRQPPPIRVNPLLLETASLPADGVYQRLQTRPSGLTTEEAEARLVEHGLNTVAADAGKSFALLVWHAVINPLVLLLAVLASHLLLHRRRPRRHVMSVMIVLSVGLRLIQERRAEQRGREAEGDDLGHGRRCSATAQPQEIAVSHLVPGDVVQLGAGDMVPRTCGSSTPRTCS